MKLLLNVVFVLASSFLWSPVHVVADVIPVVPSCNKTYDSLTNWIPPLKVNNHYDGNPTQNNCTCTTAYYNLLSVCGICQRGEDAPVVLQGLNQALDSFEDGKNSLGIALSHFFSSIYKPQYSYPLPISPETAIPHWAFQDYSTATLAMFNMTLAQAQGDIPESLAPPTSTTALVTPTSNAGSKSEIKPGVIPGIVAGSLALLFMLGIGIGFRWLRQRRLAEQYQIGLHPEWSIYAANPYPLPATDATAKYQITSTKQAELQREREELAQSIHELRISRNGSTGRVGELLQTRVQEMEARMEWLTLELSRHIEPPAYENEME
ncbi:hypothetical protein BDP27DRAFT_1365163 [Rhodocollybia butyracea]|uniref:Uncharacterized protein n=1 Tax=Rhodocollybia butyracea TaxID=206335 RepID=A0A9P5PS95_9AGAR|nr:hypothetical protein BDP27DRAFT_1365163 [Rhodocollybia butyracea]